MRVASAHQAPVPDTLTGMNNLALTYSMQGKWEEVQEAREKVVEE